MRSVILFNKRICMYVCTSLCLLVGRPYSPAPVVRLSSALHARPFDCLSAGHILRKILDCTMYMASAAAGTSNGGLGAEPPAGSKGSKPWWRARGRSPPEAESLCLFNIPRSGQICLFFCILRCLADLFRRRFMETKLRPPNEVHNLTITSRLATDLAMHSHFHTRSCTKYRGRFPQKLHPGKLFLKQLQHNNVVEALQKNNCSCIPSAIIFFQT